MCLSEAEKQSYLAYLYSIPESPIESSILNYAETWEPEDNLRHAQEHIDRYVNREPGEGRRKAPKRKAIT